MLSFIIQREVPVRALISMALVCLMGIPVLAYKDGIYHCKNLRGVPDDRITVKTVSLGGVSVPYVEITRHFRSESSEVQVSKHVGFASVATTSTGHESLMLAAVVLELDNGAVRGCDRE